MRIYFHHDTIPDGLPQDAVLWPELDGASMTPRTERAIQAFVEGLPGNAVILTNSTIVLEVARTMRAENPESVSSMEVRLSDDRVVVFNERAEPDSWGWHDDVQHQCLSKLAKIRARAARKAK